MNDYAFRQVISAEELRQLSAMVDMFPRQPQATTSLDEVGDEILSKIEFLFTSWGVPRLDEKELSRLPNLKAIFHAAGTVKSFVTGAVWDRQIRVSSATQANAIPVAEYTYAMVVLALKRVFPRITAQRESGLYLPEDPHLVGAYGSTVGLLGLSRVGLLSLEQLRRLNVNILVYDPTISKSKANELGVELTTMEDVFARSHVVSCHIPLLPETVGLLRREHFAAMLPGATFLNTARGAIVREDDLADVLEERTDLWAILDVLSEEPPPPGARLPRMPNVIVTPHIAGSLGPECRRMSQMMIEDMRRYLAGEPLEGEVHQTQLAVCA